MSQPTVTIRCRENGPLVIMLEPGMSVQVVDHLGQPFPLPANKPSVALCRCGASQKKPFCDGTHKNCGFLASEVAVTQPPVGTDPATAAPPGSP